MPATFSSGSAHPALGSLSTPLHNSSRIYHTFNTTTPLPGSTLSQPVSLPVVQVNPAVRQKGNQALKGAALLVGGSLVSFPLKVATFNSANLLGKALGYTGILGTSVLGFVGVTKLFKAFFPKTYQNL